MYFNGDDDMECTPSCARLLYMQAAASGGGGCGGALPLL